MQRLRSIWGVVIGVPVLPKLGTACALANRGVPTNNQAMAQTQPGMHVRLFHFHNSIPLLHVQQMSPAWDMVLFQKCKCFDWDLTETSWSVDSMVPKLTETAQDRVLPLLRARVSGFVHMY